MEVFGKTVHFLLARKISTAGNCGQHRSFKKCDRSDAVANVSISLHGRCVRPLKRS